MGASWKFQLLPNTRDLLGVGFRMDAVGEAVANEVNDALPYRFKFHGVGKIVLCLGPQEDEPRPEPDYIEQAGVALKQMPAFDLQGYLASANERRSALLRRVVLDGLAWFEAKFDDAQFIGLARAKLPWAR